MYERARKLACVSRVKGREHADDILYLIFMRSCISCVCAYLQKKMKHEYYTHRFDRKITLLWKTRTGCLLHQQGQVCVLSMQKIRFERLSCTKRPL